MLRMPHPAHESCEAVPTVVRAPQRRSFCSGVFFVDVLVFLFVCFFGADD